MNRRLVRTSLIVLVVILLSMTLKVNGSSSEFQVVQTYWGSAANPQEVGPGDRGVLLNVVVQNIGSQAYAGLNAILQLKYPYRSIAGGDLAQGYYAGTVQVGQTATLQFQLNIDGNASVGSHFLFFSLYYGSRFDLVEGLSAQVLLLGRTDLRLSANPFTMIPSSTNSLTINVSNVGTGIASKVTVALTFPSGMSVEGDNQWYIQSIASGENKSIALVAYIQPNLSGSSIQITASLTYTDAYGTVRTGNRILGLRILSSANIPIILDVKGSDLTPGATNTLTLNIVNNQSRSISSIQALLTLSTSATSGAQALAIVGDSSSFISSVGSFGNATVEAQLIVPLSAAGMNYQFTLSLSYLDSYGLSRTESHNFGVRVLSLSRDNMLISANKNTLIAGSFNEPTITVANSGKAPVYSVTITILLPTSSATSGSSPVVLANGNQWYFEQIQPNSNVTFSPRIFASPSTIDTSYQMQISANYADKNNVTRVETKTIGFSIKGLANLEFNNLNVVPRATYPRGNFTITGDLLNTGNTRALYTSLTIRPNPYFVQTLDGSIYIGEIATNVLSSFSISSQVRPSASNGTFPLTLVFNYQNDYGDRFTAEKTINVIVGAFIPITPGPTTQPQRPNLLTNPYTYVVVSIVAVSGIYLIYRRRKRHQE